jgi:predicted membrane metal-binding protein
MSLCNSLLMTVSHNLPIPQLWYVLDRNILLLSPLLLLLLSPLLLLLLSPLLLLLLSPLLLLLPSFLLIARVLPQCRPPRSESFEKS